MSKKYQDMIGNILATFVDVVNEDKIYGFYHNSEHYYNTDYYTGNKHYFDELENLAIEKDEQESRKDKLIVGSQWECVAICYSEGISFRAPICLVNVKGIVEITEIGESDGIHYVEYSFQNGIRLDEFAMPTQQFLLCFKPIKEGNEDDNQK